MSIMKYGGYKSEVVVPNPDPDPEPTVEAFKKAGHIREILTNSSKSYYDTNIKSHHHFYDPDKKKLTDIDYQEVVLKKIPNPPKGKKIKDLEVVISLQKK